MKFPNAIIAGAQKCGTSSLYWWLQAHPEVCGSKVKEPFFFHDEILPRFNATANFHEHGIEEYAKHFDHCSDDSTVRVEATAAYIYQETARNELKKLDPNMKVVFIVREPSKRSYSEFRFNKYRMGNIDDDVDYGQWVEMQMARTGKKISTVKRGQYSFYLKKWIEVYGADNVYLVQAEKLFADKIGEMKKLAKFLGIEPEFYDSFGFLKRNETVKMRSVFLHRLGAKIQPLIPDWIQDRFLLKLYLMFNGTKMPPTTEVERKIIASIKPYFRESNDELAAMFPDFDKSLWD